MYIENEDVLDIILVQQDVLLIDLSMLPYQLQQQIVFFWKNLFNLTLIDLFLLHVQVQLNLDIFQQMPLHHSSINQKNKYFLIGFTS